ncbi:MAG: T9SS type A sorting domain-containing protein [Bacteroidota bacterium]
MKNYLLTMILAIVALLSTGDIVAQNPCHFIGYRVDTIAYSYNSIAGDTLLSMPDNTYSSVIPLGFAFRYFDVDYTKVIISNNGLITFDTTRANSSSAWSIATPIPSIDNPLNTIFGPWIDLYNVNTGFIHYKTLGSSPNSKFIVSFDSIPMFGCLTQKYTGQIILSETVNTISIHIQTKSICSNWNNGSAIEGIQNASGTVAFVATGRNVPSQWSAMNDGRRFTPINGPFPATPLCITSVDSATHKNVVAWEKPLGILIDSFVIYKETNTIGTYVPCGIQASAAFSSFIDTGSYPDMVSNRYKLAFMDSCGILSNLSTQHKTIHLTLSSGSSSSWALDWDASEGFWFPSYSIYRGASPSSMTLLTTVSNTTLHYTDSFPPTGNIYYLIEATNPAGCNPTLRASNMNYNVSMSNIAGTFNIGIPDILNYNHVNIFPNPNNGSIVVAYKINTPKTIFQLKDIMGRIVFSHGISNSEGKESFNISSLSNGIYLWEITNNEAIDKGKIVLIK